MDPRLHFALVCGAKSCPPIKMYTPDNLEEGLNSAADAVCEGEHTPGCNVGLPSHIEHMLHDSRGTEEALQQPCPDPHVMLYCQQYWGCPALKHRSW